MLPSFDDVNRRKRIASNDKFSYENILSEISPVALFDPRSIYNPDPTTTPTETLVTPTPTMDPTQTPTPSETPFPTLTVTSTQTPTPTPTLTTTPDRIGLPRFICVRYNNESYNMESFVDGDLISYSGSLPFENGFQTWVLQYFEDLLAWRFTRPDITFFDAPGIATSVAPDGYKQGNQDINITVSAGRCIDITPTPTTTIASPEPTFTPPFDTATPTPTITYTQSVTPTLTVTSTTTITPTSTQTQDATPTPTTTRTPTPTSTTTPTITQTYTQSVTQTVTLSPQLTLTQTPTITVTPTVTPTVTFTETISIPQFTSLANLRADSLSQQAESQAIYLQGYYTQSDGGEGSFIFNSTSLSADDAGVFIKPNNINSNNPGRWIRQFTGYANVEMWGAKGDGIVDDAPAIARAVDFASLNGNLVNNTVSFSSKTYYLSTCDTKGQRANGDNDFFVSPYICIGYYPGSNYKFKINLIGTGNTTLCATNVYGKTQNGWDKVTWEDGVTTIVGSRMFISLRDSVTGCLIKGITFYGDDYPTSGDASLYISNTGELSSYPSGKQYCDGSTGGIEIGSNKGTGWWGEVPLSNLREYVHIHDCNLINVHNRAINCSSAVAPGSGTQLVTITGCQFLYPKGANNKDIRGGSQSTFFTSNTRKLIFSDNYAEGTSKIPSDCPTGYPVDGIIFGAALDTTISNNTFERFGVETLYLNCDSPTYWLEEHPTNNRMPAVGGSTILQINIPRNIDYSMFCSTTASMLTPGSYWSAGYSVDAYTREIYTGGIYLINSIYGTRPDFYLNVTRVSGANFGDEFMVSRDAPVGRSLSGKIISLFNFTELYNQNNKIIDNVFTLGYASSATPVYRIPWPNGEQIFPNRHAHDPCLRTDGFQNYLSGNIMTNIYIAHNNRNPGATTIIENNKFYRHNVIPRLAGPSDKSPYWTISCFNPSDGYGMSVSMSGAVIRNNEFYYWKNTDGSNATAVASAFPIVYYNCGDFYPGSANLLAADPYPECPDYSCIRFFGVELNYAIPISIPQSFYNNSFYCFIPLSANLIQTAYQAGGIDANKTVYNNNIIFPIETINDLRSYSNVYQTQGYTLKLSGYYVPSDGGEGSFIFDSASLSADDGGAIIKPNNINSNNPGRWIRQFTGYANVEMWGAKGDGTTDDQPAIQNAIRFVELTPPYKLYFDCKTYLLSAYPLNASFVTIPKYWQNGFWQNSTKLDHLMVGYYPNTDPANPSCLNDTVSANIELIGKRAGDSVTTLSADCTYCFLPINDPVNFPYSRVWGDVYGLNCSHIIGFCRNLSSIKMTDFTLIPFATSAFPPGARTDSSTPYGIITKRGNMSVTQGFGPNKYTCQETDTPFKTEIMYLSGINFINGSRGLTTGEGAYLPGSGIKKIEVYKCQFLHPIELQNYITHMGQETNFEPGAGLTIFDSCTAEGISRTIFENAAAGKQLLGEDGFLNNQGVSAIIHNCVFNRYTIETLVAGYSIPGYYSGYNGQRISIPPIGGQIVFPIEIEQAYFNKDFASALVHTLTTLNPVGSKMNLRLPQDQKGDQYGGNYVIDGYQRGGTIYANTLSTYVTRISAGLTQNNTRQVEKFNTELNSFIGQTFANVFLFPQVITPSYCEVKDSTFSGGLAYVNPVTNNVIMGHDPACNFLGTGNYYVSGCLFDRCQGPIVEEYNYTYWDSRSVIENNRFNMLPLTALSGVQVAKYINFIINSTFYGSIFRNNSAYGPYSIWGTTGQTLTYLPSSYHQIYYNSVDYYPYDFYDNNPFLQSPPYQTSYFINYYQYEGQFTDNIITLYTPLCSDIYKYGSIGGCNNWKFQIIGADTTQQTDVCDPPVTYNYIITGNRFSNVPLQ